MKLQDKSKQLIQSVKKLQTKAQKQVNVILQQLNSL